MPNRAALWRARVEADAGAVWPVVERHRRGLTFVLPGGSCRLIRFDPSSMVIGVWG